MSFKDNVYTTIHEVHVANAGEFEVLVLLNSFKDGSIELTMTSENMFNPTVIELQAHTYEYIRKCVIPTIRLVFNNKNIELDKNFDTKAAVTIVKACLFAYNLKGKATLDYDIHCSQSKVKIGFSKPQEDNKPKQPEQVRHPIENVFKESKNNNKKRKHFEN